MMLFSLNDIFKKYSRSEVESLHVVTVWWNADGATNKLISVRQRAPLSEDHSTKGTLLV